MKKFKAIKDLKSSGSKLLGAGSKVGSKLVDSRGKLMKGLDTNLIDIPALKGKLTDGLYNTMEEAFESRKADTVNSSFTPADTDKIIKGYAKQNMILAAASSIVPGPMGMLGAIPELLLNMRNQMYMIYDLSCAHGKENFINRDLLLDIPIAAFGGNTNLGSLQNLKEDLADSPKDVLMGKTTQLGGALIERTLKKSVVQFIPVAGPIVMASWSKIATAKISKGSLSFLDNAATYTEHFKPDEDQSIHLDLKREKIKGLINLIEANNEIHEAEIEFINSLIEASDLERGEKDYFLTEALKTGSNLDLNYGLLKEYEEDMELIMEMAVMAKRDGLVDELEKTYIRKVARDLNVEASLVDELFAS